MVGRIFKRAASVGRCINILGTVFLLAGCWASHYLDITEPSNGSYVLDQPVSSLVQVKLNPCGPFRAILDGNDVTGKFGAFPHVGASNNTDELGATFNDLPLGPHTLIATAELERRFAVLNHPTFSQCTLHADAVKFTVGDTRDTKYMKVCRTKGVPIPPDWIPPDGVDAQPPTAWRLIGRTTSIISGVSLDTDINLYAYSDPYVRGACIARAGFDRNTKKSDGFNFICQSATMGYACFWQQGEGFPGWLKIDTDKMVEINMLDDGFKLDDCTQCHRGNNVFIIRPDQQPFWQILQNESNDTVSVTGFGPSPLPIGANFETRVEGSTDVKFGRPRFIPIGGGNVNFLPVKSDQACSNACHENHQADIAAVGVSFPAGWMPAACNGPVHEANPIP